MLREKTIAIILTSIALSVRLAAGVEVSEVKLGDAAVALPDPKINFIMPSSRMYARLDALGPQLLVYCNYSSDSDGFLLQLVRDPDMPSCLVLLLFEGERIREAEGKPIRQRMALAGAKRTISPELALTLYRHWVRILMGVRYGRNEVSTGSVFPIQFIAIDSFQTGCIAGFAEGVKNGSDVERFSRIGALLKAFVNGGDAASEEKILVYVKQNGSASGE